MNNATVIKTSGLAEAYDRRKIRNSLLNTGVSPKAADDIIDKVAMTLMPPLTTRKIYHAARKLLSTYDKLATMKYSLKKAIFSLGPTGYPFEKYVARILEGRGYKVTTNEIVQGHCVAHEVDIMAHNTTECYIVECKFHNDGKGISNIKTALYVQSRVQDIKRAWKYCGKHREVEKRGMLVTNTRLTSEAIKYAKCVGLRAVGWKHPEHESLEMMIEQDRTYPITVLPGVNNKNVRQLLGGGIVVLSDIQGIAPAELHELTGIGRDVAHRLKRQIGKLFS